MRATLIWCAFGIAIAVPLFIAATSPLLQWRQPAYIVGGFAGVVGLALMLLQPVFIAGVLPGINGRRVHRWLGCALVGTVVLHVAGLWITSPPDVVDVLVFRSPTPFGIWGAVAMWAVFAAALLALFRRRLTLRVWRIGHSFAVTLAACGTVAHALLIEGTMGMLSKIALCGFVLVALGWVIYRRRAWRVFRV